MGNEHWPCCDGLCVVPDPYQGDQEEKGGTMGYQGGPEQVCLPKPFTSQMRTASKGVLCSGMAVRAALMKSKISSSACSKGAKFV